jgi:hypothetical protein
VETLFITTKANGVRKKDWVKLEQILGPELKKEFWGAYKDSENALRHRLVHGRYFGPEDGAKDHLNLLHKRIISYFNAEIFKGNFISENVVNPQRHPFGHQYVGHSFIQAQNQQMLSLVHVLSDMNEDGEFTYYERVVDEDLRANY